MRRATRGLRASSNSTYVIAGPIDVLAVGSPRGFEGSVTKGIISAVRRMNDVIYIQTDTPINHGNSGGPLLDENGVVLGVNTWKRVETSDEGLGFAVSIDFDNAQWFGRNA